MKIYEVSSYEELSEKAADIIAKVVKEKPDCVLGLATGSSPVGTYKELIKRYEAGELDFSNVRSVNLDEYVGLDGSNEQSYRYFMDKNLFDHINIQKFNTNVPSGISDNMHGECERYENMINGIGGVDIQLLGIGHDGHIGFNEPADNFPVKTHVVELEETTIRANSRFFDNIEDVPKRAITMGIGTIMKSKKILLIASGADKRQIVEKAFYGPVTPEVPASILQFHPDFTLVYCFN